MKKRMLIMNIISLIFTTALLILVTYAWYATNKVAQATGGMGKVGAQETYVESVGYYKVTSKANTVYSVSSKYDTLPMDKFDIVQKKITACVIEIKLKKTCNISALTAQSDRNEFIGYITSTSGLSLSSVLELTFVSDGSLSNGSFSFSNPLESKSFFNNSNYSNTINFITSDIENVNYLYFVLDYSLDAMNALYSANIGNTVLETASDLRFICDFSINLVASEGGGA